MKVGILCQEEPVFLGPFLREVILLRPEAVAGVVVAGARSAGERRRTVSQRLESLLVFWLIFEPVDFFRSLGLRARRVLLGWRDPRSVEGLARSLGIRVLHLRTSDPAAVAAAIERLGADIVLNQSEILLDAHTLSLPPHGFLNRHATLLPEHRGRLGSFRCHADVRPRYGVTIHRVDEGIDTGDIVEQWGATDVDPRWPFPRMLRHVNAAAPELFWKAVDRVERGAAPRPNPSDGERPHRFPTLAEAREYRALLVRRRAART